MKSTQEVETRAFFTSPTPRFPRTISFSPVPADQTPEGCFSKWRSQAEVPKVKGPYIGR